MPAAPPVASAATQVGNATPVPATTGGAGGVTARGPAGCPPITPAAIALGRTILNGPGHCSVCHGADASGTAMAPSLHAHKWLNIDGSYAAIVGLVNRGVATPKAHSEMMPPRGGADLSPGQVCAVAADVFSMSHATGATSASASAAPSPGAGAPAPRAPGGTAPRQAAAAPPVPVTPAAPAAAGGAQTSSASSGTLTMQVTFTWTPDNHTIRIDNPDRTSSTYTCSGNPAPPPPPESTATPPGTAAAAAPPAVPGAAESASASPAPAVSTTATQAPGCPPIAPPLVVEGRKIFRGGGNCYACHGDNGTGTPMAPTLRAHAWLDADGSYASIVQLVTNGVATPKAHPAPMPPKGGSQVTGAQVCAVAAYVYSLSH